MADYIIYTPFVIPLPVAQQGWAKHELERPDEDDGGDPHPGVICEKGDYLWIRHDDQGANIDALCARLQTIMKHFDVPGTWGFQWSQDCSAPRTDAYAGGACVVSQTEITEMTTGMWLAERGVR
jgi:hypothetical protein